jgi:membrane protease YdiL (CAAX protease family)
MQDRKLFRLIGALAAGLAYFAILMGLSMALAGVNASVSPNIPWFPLPALVGITAVTIWVQRYWPLRLNRPSPTHTHRLYALALCATLAAMCISLIEASMHGLTRTGPLWEGEVSAAFQLAFLLVIPFIASVLAELAFRGVIQTELEKWLPLWPMLFIIAALNAAFHFYDPEQASQWVRFITLNLGFGYVTWLAQSLWPALLAHVTMNIIEPIAETVLGPVALGDLSTMTLVLIGALGSAALGTSLYLAGKIKAEQAAT